jgi:hypothetical protein
MVYRIKIKRPGLPNGAKLQIGGLGIVENGKWFAVDDDLHASFRAAHQRQSSETDEQGNMTVKTEMGPTLIQAFEHDADVTVEKVPDSRASTPTQEAPAQDPPAEEVATQNDNKEGAV